MSWRFDARVRGEGSTAHADPHALRHGGEKLTERTCKGIADEKQAMLVALVALVMILLQLRVRKQVPKPRRLPHCVQWVPLLEEGYVLPEESRVESTFQVRLTHAALVSY